MRTPLVAALLGFASLTAGASADTLKKLPRATPESQGISSAALLPMIEEADQRALGLHAIMIVRHGHVVAEGWWSPYAATEPHMLFSLSKSFTSTAIGMLQADGKLSINDPILKYFPGDAPAEPSENLREMRIRDLLIMSTGQHKEDVDKINVLAADKSGTKQFLAAPVPHKPGTLFYYNSPGTFMLSAIVQKVSGQTVRDFLTPRLFEPLGIKQPDWDITPQGYNRGASGLHMVTEDIAKFGQLYLQRGEWEGRRLLPAAWIDVATSRQASNGGNPESDWDQGYGYQFWRCIPGFYRGDGAFGQFCIVMPQYDTVVAINSGTNDMQSVMKLIWTRLIPELRPVAIPENPDAHAKLIQRLASLTMKPQAGNASSPTAVRILGRRFLFGPDAKNRIGLEAVELEKTADGSISFSVKIHGAEQRVAVGQNQWIKGSFAFNSDGGVPVAVSGAWTADDIYTLQFCQYQAPFTTTARLRFTGDDVTLSYEQNVGNPPEKSPAFTGHAS
ncbi:MAG TPA: serine hydrolase [Lacunisphaera sp.]|jgi:CubicO group peptidase (beta-lactamase class C family)